MLNQIRVTYKDGSTNTTAISQGATTREVKEYYSDTNFLRIQDKQVTQIDFLTKFKDMLPGERSLTSVAYYDKNAECYLF